MARPGECIPAVTLYADQDQIQTAFQKISKAWLCYHCKKEFNLLGSMGQLECDQHPGYVQEDGRWSCCGRKQYPARWTVHRDNLRYYTSHMTDEYAMPYQPIPKVRGCQKCDHNTSDAAFTHKDAMPITDLSALLPEINKKFPFHLRKGFDQGVLRRCDKRQIVVPPNAKKVVYMDNDGEEQIYDVEEGTGVPEGIELNAEDYDGNPITEWH